MINKYFKTQKTTNLVLNSFLTTKFSNVNDKEPSIDNHAKNYKFWVNSIKVDNTKTFDIK